MNTLDRTATDQQFSKPLYTVTIYEDATLLTEHNGSNGDERFVVSQEQLMRFFTTSVTFRPEPGLIAMTTNGPTERYVFDVPKGKKPTTVLYQMNNKTVRRYPFHLPGMVLEVTVEGKRDGRRITDLSAYLYSGTRVGEDSVLYVPPFPNIMHDGAICLGTAETTVPVGTKVRATALKVLFGSAFNHHQDTVAKEKIPMKQYHKKYRGRVPLRTLKRAEPSLRELTGNR